MIRNFGSWLLINGKSSFTRTAVSRFFETIICKLPIPSICVPWLLLSLKYLVDEGIYHGSENPNKVMMTKIEKYMADICVCACVY